MREELSAIVGDEHVATARRSEVEDASIASSVRARDDALLVRPGSAEEVAAVVAWCYAHDAPIVPRGGGTGYAGGAVPIEPRSVVVSTERLKAGDKPAELEAAEKPAEPAVNPMQWLQSLTLEDAPAPTSTENQPTPPAPTPVSTPAIISSILSLKRLKPLPMAISSILTNPFP